VSFREIHLLIDIWPLST